MSVSWVWAVGIERKNLSGATGLGPGRDSSGMCAELNWGISSINELSWAGLDGFYVRCRFVLGVGFKGALIVIGELNVVMNKYAG